MFPISDDCGSMTIVYAPVVGSVAVVSPFRYTVVPLSLLFGVTVFGDIPDAAALVGIGVIVLSGLYTFYREQRVRGPESTSLTPAVGAGEKP